jgi:hypothetical protein
MKRKGEKFDPPKNITRLKISTTLHERKAPPGTFLCIGKFYNPKKLERVACINPERK